MSEGMKLSNKTIEELDLEIVKERARLDAEIAREKEENAKNTKRD